MKKVYTKIAHTARISANDFYSNVREATDKMQEAGLEVEIQYQTGNDHGTALFTALILGYEMKED